MSLQPQRKCEACSSSETQDEVLYCRLYPPQVTILVLPMQDALGRVQPTLQTLASQPSVKPDAFCMQWTPLLRFQT